MGTIAQGSTAMLIAVVLGFAVVSASATPSPPPNLTITSTLSSSSSVQTPVFLYPGVTDYLWYNVSNARQVPVTVTSISITAITAPAGCPSSDLDTSHSTFSGTLTIPARGSGAVAKPISLIETHTNQNACRGGVWNFTINYSLQYTEVYATSTVVNSSLNPSNVGQSVTYTATIAASATPSQDAVPSSPTGTVTFKDGSTTICSAVAVMSSGTTTATATCSPPTYVSTGTHPITAVFTNTDSNFVGSTSPILSQVVRMPTLCNGTYANSITGYPTNLTVNGTNQNDFISLFFANYTSNGLNGNDCMDAGDGNNTLTDGNGNDVVLAGNGNNNVNVGNGSDVVNVGNGSNTIVVGNGPDTLTLGNGASNRVTLGNGADVVTIQGGSHDTIIGGNATQTIYLGGGMYNSFTGSAQHPSVCHLPAPAATLHDTITNCTVVTP